MSKTNSTRRTRPACKDPEDQRQLEEFMAQCQEAQARERRSEYIESLPPETFRALLDDVDAYCVRSVTATGYGGGGLCERRAEVELVENEPTAHMQDRALTLSVDLLDNQHTEPVTLEGLTAGDVVAVLNGVKKALVLAELRGFLGAVAEATDTLPEAFAELLAAAMELAGLDDEMVATLLLTETAPSVRAERTGRAPVGFRTAALVAQFLDDTATDLPDPALVRSLRVHARTLRLRAGDEAFENYRAAKARGEVP